MALPWKPQVGDDVAVLAGREEILARAAALVDQARNGVSGVMTVVGGAGLGKTALLSEIIAAESGVDVVTAVGVPAESSLGFGGLALLIGELDAHTVALTGWQRAHWSPLAAGERLRSNVWPWRVPWSS